eukprot:CAMPEP_0174955582 /NCGR_PEP_ID=MMETSP0004_2-20121128/1058_1 /TAXON_ID=420556 /ORGANISM="Ochromonas sp., Strain CCMP1393" /LENGTH=61 /DNA_ID=CAMNT_0016203519 /DNA_START=451 /DNA_END=636 /DNA_ORIENTATION=-
MEEYDQSDEGSIPKSVFDYVKAKGEEIVQKFVEEVERRNINDLIEIWPPENCKFVELPGGL